MTEFRLKNRERVDLENFMLHTPSVKASVVVALQATLA